MIGNYRTTGHKVTLVRKTGGNCRGEVYLDGVAVQNVKSIIVNMGVDEAATVTLSFLPSAIDVVDEGEQIPS